MPKFDENSIGPVGSPEWNRAYEVSDRDACDWCDSPTVWKSRTSDQRACSAKCHASLAAGKAKATGPSREWLKAASDAEDNTRSVSVGGLMAEADDTKHDPVSRPSHYTAGGVEVIDALEAWGLDHDFCLGNVVKYVARAGKKDSSKLTEDLKKARWYLDRRIKRLETNG